MSLTQTVIITPGRELNGRVRGSLRQNGAAIRSLREKDGWHQPDFAREVGMSQSALSNIEREKRSARPVTIYRIARALRVPVAAITRAYDEPDGSAVYREPQNGSAYCRGGVGPAQQDPPQTPIRRTAQ